MTAPRPAEQVRAAELERLDRIRQIAAELAVTAAAHLAVDPTDRVAASHHSGALRVIARADVARARLLGDPDPTRIDP